LKAMQKEASDRYPSVEHLLEDINAFENNRPITAQADSWTYRGRKFILRNKLTVISLSTIFILLLSSVILFSWQSIQLKQEKEKAEIEADIANQTTEFMIELFETADPRHAGTQFVTARDLLDTAVEELHSDKIENNATRARLLLHLGLAYQHLDDAGTNELGIASMRESLALTETVFGRRSLQSAEVLQRLGDAIRESTNDDQEALELLKEGLEIRLELTPVLNDDIGDSFNNLALAMYDMGRVKEAEVMNKKAIEIRTDLLDPPEIDITNLGYIFRQRGFFHKAIEQANKALELLGNEESNAYNIKNNLLLKAQCYRKLGQFNKSLLLIEEAHPWFFILYGENRKMFFRLKREKAQTLHAMGELKQAENIYKELEVELSEEHSPDSSYYDYFYAYYGLLKVDLGHLDKGVELFAKGYKRLEERYGSTFPLTDTFKIILAELQIKQGKYSLAETALNQVLATYDGVRKDPDLDMAITLKGLAHLAIIKNQQILAQNKISQAIKILEEPNLDKRRLMRELEALESLLAPRQ
jgi:tetratricopeptide (TPR) repeat protein